MNTPEKILLINFGGIGDEILFLPVLQSLKQKFPDCKITLCLEGRSKAFLGLTDLVDNYFFADIKTKNKYIQMIKLWFKALTGGFDTVISSGASPLISLLLFFTGIKSRTGYKTNKLSEILLTNAVELNKNQYAAKMYFDLVKPVTNGEFELPKIKNDNCERFSDTVVVHPGVSAISISKKIYKTFDGKIWAEITDKLIEKGKKVCLAGGPDDTKCIKEIRACLKSKDNPAFCDMFGKTKNIFDLVKLIGSAEVLVCSDSAPMHIGVATNTKTVAFFGPTDDKKLLPDSPNFKAVTNNCDCRPCLWEKRQTSCSELKCLDINIEDIVNAVIS